MARAAGCAAGNGAVSVVMFVVVGLVFVAGVAVGGTARDVYHRVRAKSWAARQPKDPLGPYRAAAMQVVERTQAAIERMYGKPPSGPAGVSARPSDLTHGTGPR